MIDLTIIVGPPAADELIEQLATCVRHRHKHGHPVEGVDLFCLNLATYLGEHMGPVLARLRDAEAEVKRLRGDHDRACENATNWRHAADVIAEEKWRLTDAAKDALQRGQHNLGRETLARLLEGGEGR